MSMGRLSSGQPEIFYSNVTFTNVKIVNEDPPQKVAEMTNKRKKFFEGFALKGF